MVKKNGVVTIAGIMAALGSVPILVATSGVTPPTWWAHLAFPFILVGIIGTVLLGWAAKGQDEHSTEKQVETATQVAKTESAVAATKLAEEKP